MQLFYLLSLFPDTVSEPNSLPSWMAVAIAAIAAGTLTHKQRRKLRWRMA